MSDPLHLLHVQDQAADPPVCLRNSLPQLAVAVLAVARLPCVFVCSIPLWVVRLWAKDIAAGVVVCARCTDHQPVCVGGWGLGSEMGVLAHLLLSVREENGRPQLLAKAP